MNETPKSRRDFIQNITIAVLTVSAVLLFVQSQASTLGASSSFSKLFSGPDVQATSTVVSQQEDVSLSIPLRVAVASSYGRYGDISVTTSDDNFLSLRQLLEQAIGSAQSVSASTSQTFLSALNGTSVYYDFLSPVSLSSLANLSQINLPQDQFSAWHIVIAEEVGSVFLHCWDGESRYYRSRTAIPPEDLQEVVSLYELGNAFFAYESNDSHAQTIAPLSLFLEETPVIPQLSASSPLSDTTLLLASLHFNPNTQNRYLDSDGTEVISESNNRTLRIHADGTVVYQSDGDPTLFIEAESTVPTLTEAVTETHALLSALFSSSSGDARIHLEKIQQTEDTTVLHFGYQVGGIPIRFSNGQSAAVVTLSGTTVSSMELCFRHYTVTENASLLLPLPQTLAIAAKTPDHSLSIGYADTGRDTVSATWLAD
jgi:hypothetical protein